MRRELLMALALAFVGAACDGEEAARMPTSSSEVGELGSINLSLIGTDSKGTQYRLRSAQFVIAKEGPEGSDAGLTELETLSTELDPDAPYLSTRLAPGIYQVTIVGDWYIERLSEGGAERVDDAVLIGSAMKRTHVVGRSAALVFYRFGIDGDVVDFDSGELRIGVDFQLPLDAGLDGGGADAGEDTDAGAEEPDAGPADSDAGQDEDESEAI